MRWFITALGISLLVFLGSYNQPYYPVTWFDEGLTLQGALNLGQYDQYAMRSVEGFRVLDQPLIANGPGIVLPVAAVFEVFGPGLIQARFLMVFYFVATALTFFWLSSRFSGAISATLSTFFLLGIPDEGFVFLGRQVLGNVPALLYFFLGFLLFLELGRTQRFRYAVGAGILFGLALVTKGQYWILIVALGVILAADLTYYKQIGLLHALTVLLGVFICLLAWSIVQYLLLGADRFTEHLSAIRSSANVTVFAFRAARIPGNLWYLIRSGFLVFVFPGLALAAWDSRHRTPLGLGRFSLVVFVFLWLSWYVFGSVGWHRYAFEAYSAGLIFSGEAYLRIFSAGFSHGELFSKSNPKKRSFLNAGLLLTFFLISLSWAGKGLLGQVQRLNENADTSPQMFSEYLNKNIAEGSVIESWEWEIDLLTPELAYHHPTNDWVDRETARIQFGERSDAMYDPSAIHPDYLIVGPFAKWTGIYSNFLSSGCCIHVTTVGKYSLYEVMYIGNHPKENSP